MGKELTFEDIAEALKKIEENIAEALKKTEEIRDELSQKSRDLSEQMFKIIELLWRKRKTIPKK